VRDIINSDTVIVGGGITGLYTCYKLKQLKALTILFLCLKVRIDLEAGSRPWK
jgi:cation diffusion facilitator CzcD-associated flavoprotein CzcO